MKNHAMEIRDWNCLLLLKDFSMDSTWRHTVCKNLECNWRKWRASYLSFCNFGFSFVSVHTSIFPSGFSTKTKECLDGESVVVGNLEPNWSNISFTLKAGQICAFGSRIREKMMDDGLWILRKKKRFISVEISGKKTELHKSLITTLKTSKIQSVKKNCK